MDKIEIGNFYLTGSYEIMYVFAFLNHEETLRYIGLYLEDNTKLALAVNAKSFCFSYMPDKKDFYHMEVDMDGTQPERFILPWKRIEIDDFEFKLSDKHFAYKKFIEHGLDLEKGTK